MTSTLTDQIAEHGFMPVVGADNGCWVTVNPTLGATTDYAANDYVGASSDAMEFTSTDAVTGSKGMIISAVLIDAAVQSVSGELWLFDSEPTPPAASAAWSISDADAKKVIGIIPFSTYYASALNSVSKAENLTIPFKFAPGSTTIYGCFVTRGAPAYATDSLTFRLFILGLGVE